MPILPAKIPWQGGSRHPMTDFVRFPHTFHVAWLGNNVPRDDKILSQKAILALMSGDVIVEEKIDGANIGMSFDDSGNLRVQNRGQYLETPYKGQFSRLSAWLAQHEPTLKKILDANMILFGEWCAAVHSVHYTALPDWVLFFDIYDRRAEKFWSVRRRNSLLSGTSLSGVPELVRGRLTVTDLVRLLSNRSSQFSESYIEGVIVRNDSGDWCTARAKLVRTEFVQAIDEHWSRGEIHWNQLREYGTRLST